MDDKYIEKCSADTLSAICQRCYKSIPAININGEGRIGKYYKLRGKIYCLKCFLIRLIIREGK